MKSPLVEPVTVATPTRGPEVPWRPLVVSAPFGNYIQPAGCTATLGTFTTMPRGGRIGQMARTLRYYPRIKAWVNRIGLRNPGIGWLQKKVQAGKIDLSDKLVSIHGFDEAQWTELMEKTAALGPLGIELNMSCPNVGEVSWPASLFGRAASLRDEHQAPVIVKLPPVNYARMVDAAVEAGLTSFHCCNTLPVPAGGLSGHPLKPVAMQCIADLRTRPYGDRLHILGGGGIRTPEDIDDYCRVGADSFAVGTKLMHPWYLVSHKSLAKLLERASACFVSH